MNSEIAELTAALTPFSINVVHKLNYLWKLETKFVSLSPNLFSFLSFTSHHFTLFLYLCNPLHIPLFYFLCHVFTSKNWAHISQPQPNSVPWLTYSHPSYFNSHSLTPFGGFPTTQTT